MAKDCTSAYYATLLFTCGIKLKMILIQINALFTLAKLIADKLSFKTTSAATNSASAPA